MRIICILLFVYWLVLIVRVLASWFPIPPSGPIRSLMSLVYALTEPVMRPLRNLIPPLRMGAVGFDLSPIIVFVALGILQRAICT
ncbi:MAG: YggT family protein [Actinomycetota bacterium]|jgi:YggT family protein